MNRSDIGRVRHQATRTATPGTTRQSGSAVPIGSREQLRSRNMMQRSAPTHRAEDDKEKDDKDENDELLPDRAGDDDKVETDTDEDDDKKENDEKKK